LIVICFQSLAILLLADEIEGNEVYMIDERVPHWYAFVTRPRHEKKVFEHLQKAGITSFLPLRKTLNQWKDRKKWVEAPLFSCYIFSHIPYINRYDVLKVPSVVRIVGFERRPTPVRESEIEAIKTILRSGCNIDVVNGFLPGDRVQIKSGPLAGFEGNIVDHRGKKWLEIYIEVLAQSILVDPAENMVEKLIAQNVMQEKIVV